jgi:stage II sporulation protein D
VTYTDGGGVDTIVIGGITYTGKKIRSLLSLNSTKFEITADGTSITVTAYGYGHRVGMSQHGANAMAKLGCTYDQILKHYFQSTELTKWDS